MESINLNNNLETIDLNRISGGGNGGGLGLEFLMNTSIKDKKSAKKSSSSSIELNDITDLENELNDISGVGAGGATGNLTFEEINIDNEVNSTFDFSNKPTNTNTTWDGYSSKIEDIPVQRDSGGSGIGTPKLTERQKRQKKMMMIQKLEDWSKRGLIELVGNSHYTMDMDFEEIEDEYENLPCL